MAENQVNYQNFVNVVGYLKDNTLKGIVTKTGKEAISGQLVIAINADEEYRVKFMASKTYNDGKANPLYTSLTNLLPDKTITLKTILEANEGMTFDQAIVQVSKVWANANFDIYDRKNENGVIDTSIMLNAKGAGLHTANSKKPFEPRATFKVEGYVNKLKNEVKNETETGRVEVELLLPDTFHETVLPITFMIDDVKTGSAVMDAWSRGNTVYAEGYLKNARVESAPARAGRVSLMGHQEEVKPTYSFVNERIIAEPYPAVEDTDVKYIKPDTIRTYLANRQKLLDELEVTATRDNSNNAQPLTASTTSTANTDGKQGFVL